VIIIETLNEFWTSHDGLKYLGLIFGLGIPYKKIGLPCT